MNLIIVADENMPGLEAFESLGRVRKRPGRSLGRGELQDADILLVRSVTPVNAALLSGTPVRFVGSATIGTDHVDRDWLAEQGIAFCHAPGCNAMAVAEYVLQALLRWCRRGDRAPGELSLGLVGCGNVGRRVARLALDLGMTLLVNDPPRTNAGESLPGRAVGLEEALAADVVSLHVPLTDTGDWPTRHLLDERRLIATAAGQLLINTSRGPVIDNRALRSRLDGKGPDTVLDVWEHEPGIDPDLFHRVLMGTPHIAGYSREGKLRGTAMVYQGCREWLGLEAPAPEVAPSPGQYCGDLRTVDDLLALLALRYDLPADHRRLAESLETQDPASAFDELRRHYPLRHECAGLQVAGEVERHWWPLLTSLGVTR